MLDKTSLISFGGAPNTDAVFTRGDDGTASLSGLSIFRSGTHTDSLGRESEWTDADLRKMVSNFNKFRKDGTFANIPVRANHDRGIESVIGYFTGAKFSDGYLMADIEFTEPEAADKWERGTYRSRSSEIGTFTDGEAEHWPFLYGVAFVDLPAVSGLFTKELDTEDSDMTFTQEQLDEAVSEAVVDATDTAHAAGLAEGIASHAKPDMDDKAPATFSVNGVTEANYASVQAHIDKLETFATETAAAARTDFVNGLAETGVITAPQVEGLTAFAGTLSTDQFTAFTASYENAVPQSIFDKHGDLIAPLDDPDTGEGPSALDTALEIVAMHARGGQPASMIENTPSYALLKSAGKLPEGMK